MQENYIPSVENPIITKDAITGLVVLIKTELSTLSNTTATKEEVQQAIQNLTNVLSLQPGAVLKENLATLADTAKVGQVFLVSDDGNHLYVFFGKEAAGADENGFYDLGDHFDFSGFATTEALNELGTKYDQLEPRVKAGETRVGQIEDAIKKLEGGSETLGFTVFEDTEMQELWNSVVTD